MSRDRRELQIVDGTQTNRLRSQRDRLDSQSGGGGGVGARAALLVGGGGMSERRNFFFIEKKAGKREFTLTLKTDDERDIVSTSAERTRNITERDVDN